MKNNFILIASLGLLLYVAFNKTDPIQKVVSGTKVLKIPARQDFSSAWKKNLPVPTNLWGGHPYGWRGSDATGYLRKAG